MSPRVMSCAPLAGSDIIEELDGILPGSCRPCAQIKTDEEFPRLKCVRDRGHLICPHGKRTDAESFGNAGQMPHL